MSSDLTTGTPQPLGAAAPAATPSGVDLDQMRAELERIRGERDQLASGLQQLRPYAEDIEWLTQDPGNQQFLRESRKAYDDARKARNAVPEELRPIAEKVDRLNSFVDNFEAAQQRAAAEPHQRWLQEGRSFCEGLISKHPNELGKNADPSLAWAGALERICQSRGLTWEEGWKILQPAFVKEVSGPPPTSMRADTGFAGLPPPSRQPVAGDPAGKKLGQIVLERMQSMS